MWDGEASEVEKVGNAGSGRMQPWRHLPRSVISHSIVFIAVPSGGLHSAWCGVQHMCWLVTIFPSCCYWDCFPLQKGGMSCKVSEAGGQRIRPVLSPTSNPHLPTTSISLLDSEGPPDNCVSILLPSSSASAGQLNHLLKIHVWSHATISWNPYDSLISLA